MKTEDYLFWHYDKVVTLLCTKGTAATNMLVQGLFFLVLVNFRGLSSYGSHAMQFLLYTVMFSINF